MPEQPTIEAIFDKFWGGEMWTFDDQDITIFKHQLLDHLLALPYLQEITHGWDEDGNCNVCDYCWMCDTQNSERREIRKALTRAILGEGEGE